MAGERRRIGAMVFVSPSEHVSPRRRPASRGSCRAATALTPSPRTRWRTVAHRSTWRSGLAPYFRVGVDTMVIVPCGPDTVANYIMIAQMRDLLSA
jgi:hypothetical protein